MIVFPSCKINLGLRIPAKRTDGYHAIETIFYPVSLNDGLEAIAQPNTPSSQIQFTSSGLSIHGATDDNLCVKAYHLLKKQFPQLPSVSVHLHKVIPMGAGLGGGSSDGAFMLRLLNELFSLSLSEKQLSAYALELGSDCPFFVYDQPCYALGRGEELEPISLSLKEYSIILVYPALHVATAKAFAALHRTTIPKSYDHTLKEIIQLPIQQWKTSLINEFEEPVMQQYPEIAQIKNRLYEEGALYASMTGSGSTVFGIFHKAAAPKLNFPDHYFEKRIED